MVTPLRIGTTISTVEVDKGAGFTRGTPAVWQRYLPVRIEAMALTRDTLFAAGPPDVLKRRSARRSGRSPGRRVAGDRPGHRPAVLASPNLQSASFRRHGCGRQSPADRDTRRQVNRLGMNHRLRYTRTPRETVKLCHRFFAQRMGRELQSCSVGGMRACSWLRHAAAARRQDAAPTCVGWKAGIKHNGLVT